METRAKPQKILFLLVIAVLVVGLVACTGNATTPSGTQAASAKPATDSGKATDAPQPPADTGELATLDWYIGLGEPLPDHKAVNNAINEYLKEKINANVNLIYWTSADWESKMTVMVSSGQDLGIIGFGSQSKLDYVVQSKAGSFYPIEALLDKYPDTKKLFKDEVWNGMKINDHIYGIPSLKDNCYIMGFYYNKTLADELGIDLKAAESLKGIAGAEAFFTDAMEKRTAKYGKVDEPIYLMNWTMEVPCWFAVETFLNDNNLAVCNIDGIMDIAGKDSNTVFNLYDTKEFRDGCLAMQRMAAANIIPYDYQDAAKMGEYGQSKMVLAFPNWGLTYVSPSFQSPNFEATVVPPARVWTDTNNYFSAGTAISANCKNPEAAMKVLNFVNTDTKFATMMRFGVEGVNYRRGADDKMTFEGSNNADTANRAYYYWYGAPIGNLTIVEAPTNMVGPNNEMMNLINKYNSEAKIPAHLGFVFDTTPVANELAACTNVVLEYRDSLRFGQLGSAAEVNKAIDDFNKKLKDNGSEKIITEVQKQLDAWKTAK